MIIMLRIFIGSINKTDKRYCEYNDAWFDKYVDSIKFDNNITKIIKLIDGVDYIGNYRVRSKFVKDIAISVKELSSGCKTVINVASFNNQIFSAAECGDNALQVLFNLKKGNVYLPFFVIPRKFINDIEIDYNGNILIIHNNKELEDILYQLF